jgi:RimJ/RimL family protein N-acetyltransferase
MTRPLPDPPSLAPTLTTPRLTLSGHGLADFADSFALWSNPDVVRFIGGVPSTEEEVWTRLIRHRGMWALFGFGGFAIRETASGAFVGEAGLMRLKRAITPPLGADPEAGWALMPWAHGKGYAREAMEAILAWTDQTLGATRTVCIIDPNNGPSLRLAERLGYRRLADALYREEPILELERLAPV